MWPVGTPAGIVLWLAASAAMLLPAPATGATFAEHFDGLSLSTDLQWTASPAFAFDMASGQGRAIKSAGSGPGFVVLQTTFAMAGDFSVDLSVDRSHTSGSPSVGLSVQSLDGTSYAAIWIQPPQRVGYEINAPDAYAFRAHASQALVLSFNIVRVADTLYLSGNGGQGVYLSKGHEQLGVPMLASAFFYWTDPGYDGQSVAHFDDFSLTADSLIPAVPEPSVAVLLLLGGLLLARRCRRLAGPPGG